MKILIALYVVPCAIFWLIAFYEYLQYGYDSVIGGGDAHLIDRLWKIGSFLPIINIFLLANFIEFILTDYGKKD